MHMKNLLWILGMVIVSITAYAATPVFTNAAAGTHYINITLINQRPDPAEPGSLVELRFMVENWGADSADDVTMELLPSYPFSLEGEAAEQDIGTLQGRQTDAKAVIVKYKVRVADNAVEGSNEIQIRYKVKDIWYKPEPFSIDIETHDAIIAVESVTTKPMAPGSRTPLEIKIKNLADSLLKDIKVSLELHTTKVTTTTVVTTEYPFSPIGSSNEKVIQSMEPGETQIVTFELAADPDAESNVYKVPLTIAYSDELRTNYSKSVVIGIVIGDTPDLVVNLDDTTIKTGGTSGTATLRFINKGTSNVKFVYVSVEDKNPVKVTSSKESYIGKIDSDDYETVDFDLYVAKSREKAVLPVTMQYKDALNEDYTQHFDVELPIYSGSEARQYGAAQGNGFVGMLVVIVIIAVGLFLFFRYRKRKKKR